MRVEPVPRRLLQGGFQIPEPPSKTASYSDAAGAGSLLVGSSAVGTSVAFPAAIAGSAWELLRVLTSPFPVSRTVVLSSISLLRACESWSLECCAFQYLLFTSALLESGAVPFDGAAP